MFATDLEKSDKAAVLAFAKTLLQITGNLNSFIYNKFDSVLQNASPDNRAKHPELFAAQDYLISQMGVFTPQYNDLVSFLAKKTGKPNTPISEAAWTLKTVDSAYSNLKFLVDEYSKNT